MQSCCNQTHKFAQDLTQEYCCDIIYDTGYLNDVAYFHTPRLQLIFPPMKADDLASKNVQKIHIPSIYDTDFHHRYVLSLSPSTTAT